MRNYLLNSRKTNLKFVNNGNVSARAFKTSKGICIFSDVKEKWMGFAIFEIALKKYWKSAPCQLHQNKMPSLFEKQTSKRRILNFYEISFSAFFCNDLMETARCDRNKPQTLLPQFFPSFETDLGSCWHFLAHSSTRSVQYQQILTKNTFYSSFLNLSSLVHLFLAGQEIRINVSLWIPLFSFLNASDKACSPDVL